jgi:predicted ATP-grasp superfamily ATP-dependent carboligase
LRACEISGVSHAAPAGRIHSASRAVVGKSILYAGRTLVAPELPVPVFTPHDPFAIPEVADIPRPGTRIEEGQPVMTVLASGADLASCEGRLRIVEESWRIRLQEGRSPTRAPRPRSRGNFP